MRVLLAEDDASLGRGLQAGLQKLGYVVDWVRDGLAVEAGLAADDGVDVLVLDLGLPRKDGLEVLTSLRAKGDDLPVLILTARDAIEQRVQGLDVGADDYMVKPCDLHELAARLRALGRRRAGRATSLLCFEDLELDPATRTLHKAGREVTLSVNEFSILALLLENAGRVLSRAQIESALYGWDAGVESNAIEVHIHHLRRKLGKELIRTVRGIGYSIPKRAG
jgi:DNA-binding response OmpR family regulator